MSPENRGAYYPTYSNKDEINDYNYQASSWSVEDGSYIRLKNVTLGYNVPAAFLAKTKAISSCRVYVAGADLWEYSKINDGWDPEASQGISGRTFSLCPYCDFWIKSNFLMYEEYETI